MSAKTMPADELYVLAAIEREDGDIAEFTEHSRPIGYSLTGMPAWDVGDAAARLAL